MRRTLGVALLRERRDAGALAGQQLARARHVLENLGLRAKLVDLRDPPVPLATTRGRGSHGGGAECGDLALELRDAGEALELCRLRLGVDSPALAEALALAPRGA